MAKRQRESRPTTELLLAARRNRYKIIRERNLVLLTLIRVSGWEAHLCKRDDPGTWKHVLCIHTPQGQLHWRLSDEDEKDFRGLKRVKNDHYDGADAKEKGERLQRLAHDTIEP